MGTNYDNVGWALIGTPGGIQSKNFGCIAGFDIAGLVDINSLVIRVLPGTEVFCYLKEMRNGATISYFLLYRYAKEIKTDRTGTFCGSLLVLVNQTVDGKLVLDTLLELLNSLENYLTPDGRFISPLAGIEIPEPTTIAAIINSSINIPGAATIGKSTGLIPLPSKNAESAISFYNFVSNATISRAFNRIYATASVETINYVKDRGQIKFIDPDSIELELEVFRLKSDNEQLRTLQDTLIREKREKESASAQSLEKLTIEIGQLRNEIDRLRSQSKSAGELKKITRELEEKRELVVYLENRVVQLESLNNELKNSLSAIIYRTSSSANQTSEQLWGPKFDKSEHGGPPQLRNRSDLYLFGITFDKKTVTILLIGLITAIAVFFLLRLYYGPEGVSDLNNTSDIKLQQTAPVHIPNKDKDYLRKAASDFFSQASSNGNIYDPGKLDELITKIRDAGLSSENMYNDLLALKQDYASLNLPFDQVESVRFSVQRDEQQLRDIVKDIYGTDQIAYHITNFLPKLLLYNPGINSETKFNIGDILIYYRPK